MKNLNELLAHEIKDLYSAEKQLIRALPAMVKASSNKSLTKGFSDHLKETRTQFDRLKEICKTLKIKPGNTKCNAMAGLIEECKKTIKEKAPSSVKDAALIACAQRVEHYEISAYGTAHQYAKTLKYDRVAELLSATLEQEKDANEHLNDLAIEQINQKAVGGTDAGKKKTKPKSKKSTAKSKK